MSDLGRYLPLSQRPRRDESHVTGDWALAISAVHVAVEHATAELDPASRDAVRSALPAGPERRARIRNLVPVVVAALRAARDAGLSLDLDPDATGAVALDLALRARYPIKAMVRSTTFVATDADDPSGEAWRVGRGSVLRAPASEIVLFLAGEGPVPVHHPVPAAPSA